MKKNGEQKKGIGLSGRASLCIGTTWAFRLKRVRAKIYFDVEISQGELEWLV